MVCMYVPAVCQAEFRSRRILKADHADTVTLKYLDHGVVVLLLELQEQYHLPEFLGAWVQ